MRRLAPILLVAWLAAPLSAQGLRVGASAVPVEADDSMVVAGGIGPARATGQEGELRATAIFIEKAPTKVAIVSCDVLFVPGDLTDRAAARLEKSVALPPSNLLVHATHTHHAPSVTAVHGYGPDPVFVKRLEDAVVRAVEQANAKLADARFSFHLAEEKTIGQNSRLLLKDGQVFWIGPRDDVVRPTGPFDPELPVFAFRDPADNLVALLFNHSTHTIGTRKGAVRSPSFYGLAAQELESQLGGVCAFLEGASGSTHNLGAVSTAQAVDRLKSAVADALARAQPRPVERLVSVKRPFAFRVRTFGEAEEDRKVVEYCRKRAPAGADYTIGVFRAMRKTLAPAAGTGAPHVAPGGPPRRRRPRRRSRRVLHRAGCRHQDPLALPRHVRGGAVQRLDRLPPRPRSPPPRRLPDVDGAALLCRGRHWGADGGRGGGDAQSAAPQRKAMTDPSDSPLEKVFDDDTPRQEAVEWAAEELYADRSFEDVAAALVASGWDEVAAAEIVEAARQRTRDHRGVLTRDDLLGPANRHYRQAMTGRWYVGMPVLAAAWRLMHSLSTLMALRRARRDEPPSRRTS